MTTRRVEINNIYSTYIFCGIIPLCNFQYRNRVRSLSLIPFAIMSQNLVEIYSMTRRRAENNNGHSTCIFCGIIPLCNFQYTNCVHFITLIPFEIISQNWVEIKSMTDDMQRFTRVAPSAFLAELFPFVIFRIEIVSTL